MKKNSNKCKINYHEEIFTYKNIEKYDEDVVDIDNNFLKVRNKYLNILREINRYAKKKRKKNNVKELEKNNNKIITNIKNELKYIDILICGDKNSGKTTFLSCISCVDYSKTNMYNFTLINNKTNIIDGQKKKNKTIIWNYNKLELLSYIPIIFSKLTNRNYDVFKKEFKKDFLDTDICESSIFITRDDLNFINYEFNLCNDSFINDFDYIKINFCEYGEDLFRKIKNYFSIQRNCRKYLKMKNEDKGTDINKEKYEKIEIYNKLCKFNKNVKKLFCSYKIRNIIETALLRIKETRYINYFINLKKCFLLIKSSAHIYNLMTKKEFKKCKNNIKIKKNNKLTYNSLVCNNMNLKKIIFTHDNNKLSSELKKKKKKKKIFLTLNEEHLLNTFYYLNIIKDLNNYDKKEMLYVLSRLFDFEKLSKTFSIYFNLNYNLKIFNTVFNKIENKENIKSINVKAIYYLIKKCVNKKWRIMKKKKNRDIIFKYYSEKKLKYEKYTKENNSHHKKNRHKMKHSKNYDIIENNENTKKKFYFLLKETLEVHNFFKIFYNEYIYKNKNRTYVRNLVKESFDICFLFLKFCFYYIQMNNVSTVFNKLIIHNFIYLKQIDIIKKDPFIYNNICIPSCVHAFINILKFNYKSEAFHSIRNYKTFLLKFIFFGISYYKLKKKSYDFYTNKKKLNHICYFTRDVIINAIVDLFEKKCNDRDKKISKKENITLSIEKKCAKNKNVLKKIINSIDINIPPFIIINSIKTNWVYFKNFMILSNMCSYYKGFSYIYPDICFEIIINFNRDKNIENIPLSKREQKNCFALCFVPLCNISFKNKIKKKKVLHFPFNHKLLKYFNDNIIVKKEKNSHLLFQLLCRKFFIMLKKFLMYYKNENYKIEVDFIFILLNYVMDIYYLMCFEKKKIYSSNENDIVITNNMYSINEGIKFKKKRIKKIIFHINQNNVIFNSLFFLWEDIKYKKKYSLKNKYIRYLKKNLFFSIVCK
ncbi:conserved Plasmodium protein, unknown function [Plasmodium gallinaceum]|uniref:Uncharacterized protein n=1 Tax=Plasmodium gallinaceum TaxID=5849 RepID=A0A1J1GSG1_PLAGA|nr:conserved Plasmodium protein, unknown function [Plasmodium gallinaceum]CRG93987.1 conserved Plasmodium protein, unknown function [Plasmodium gallinaceum]